jgi:hypothetical protein
LSLLYKLTIIFRFLSYMIIMFRLWTSKVIRVGAIVFLLPARFHSLTFLRARCPNLNLKLQFVKYCSDPLLYHLYDIFTSYHTPNTRECTRPWKYSSLFLVTLMEKD